MNRKTKIVLTIGAIAGGIAIAFATPVVNLTSPLLSTATSASPLSSHGVIQIGTSGDYFNAQFSTDGPSTVSVQDGAYSPGGQNGWHAHPGIVILTLVTGSIEWFDANCNHKIYNAGDAWTEGSQIHAFRVLGTTPAHFISTFIVSKGAALRIDKPAPACGSELGL